MKRACSTNPNSDGNLICEFHPTNKNKLFTDETVTFVKKSNERI